MHTNVEHCDRCSKQKKRLTPHRDLDLISRVPQESAIYICRTCRAPWIHCFENGWDWLMDASLIPS